MKKLLLSLTLLLTGSIVASAQCTETFSGTGTTPATTGYVAGQSFTAPCSGNLNYVQFTAATSGSNTGGTLNVYAGNGTATAPIYTQSFTAITVANVGDPIRINISGSVPITNASQYTFAFDCSLSLNASFGQYAGGDAFQAGTSVNPIDVDFEADIVAPTSVDEVESTTLTVSPNPAINVLNIRNAGTIQNVTIYNISGALVRSAGNVDVVNIADLDQGMYFLSIQTAEGISTVRFIKK